MTIKTFWILCRTRVRPAGRKGSSRQLQLTLLLPSRLPSWDGRVRLTKRLTHLPHSYSSLSKLPRQTRLPSILYSFSITPQPFILRLERSILCFLVSFELELTLGPVLRAKMTAVLGVLLGPSIGRVGWVLVSGQGWRGRGRKRTVEVFGEGGGSVEVGVNEAGRFERLCSLG